MAYEDGWTMTVTLRHPKYGEISETKEVRSLTADGLTEVADGIAYGFEERKWDIIPEEDLD